MICSRHVPNHSGNGVDRPRKANIGASASNIRLTIEVADTSLAYDRNVKLPTYNRSEIPEVWIVDLNGGIIERHTEPSENGYRLVRRAGRGETLESAVLPAHIFPVDAVLG
jgi:Uma2 family endonuclease